MKHIKTFESFVNEAFKFNPKPFDKVKPGNTAYTVGDTNAWEVLATGYGDEYDTKLKKYDESGVVSGMMKNPKGYGLTPEEFKGLEFIAIKHGNKTMVFTYDDGGAWVNESLVNEAASVPSNVMDFAKRKGPYAVALVKKAASWAEKAGEYISGGTAIGKDYSTIILDMKHQGSEIYINLNNETIELFGEVVTDPKSFAKVLAANK